MPVISAANTQAKPSILKLNSRPSSGIHAALYSSTPPSTSRGYVAATNTKAVRDTSGEVRLGVAGICAEQRARQLPAKGNAMSAMRSDTEEIAIRCPGYVGRPVCCYRYGEFGSVGASAFA